MQHDTRAEASGIAAARLSGAGRARGAYSPWRHAYAVLLTACILILICSGGMVTSKNVGLAVPDWPNSYGYNMFTFPVSRWVGGVFFEHTHRLAASTVGVLTIILAVWLSVAERRRWVRNLGYAAVGAVVLQGLLGGLRVVLVADWIGIFHACLAQAFFALAAFIALTQSKWWHELGQGEKSAATWQRTRGLARHTAAITLVMYLQMALGAAMRHAHAGLSILDFPKAYGHWWPHVHKADLPALNAQRENVLHLPPTSLAQIHLQMTHRMLAVIILLGVVAAAVGAWRRASLPAGLKWRITAWPALIAAQVTLGMYTIWTQKAADVATAHVAVGALSFMWGVLMYAALRRWSQPARDVVPALGFAPAGQPLEEVRA